MQSLGIFTFSIKKSFKYRHPRTLPKLIAIINKGIFDRLIARKHDHLLWSHMNGVNRAIFLGELWWKKKVEKESKYHGIIKSKINHDLWPSLLELLLQLSQPLEPHWWPSVCDPWALFDFKCESKTCLLLQNEPLSLPIMFLFENRKCPGTTLEKTKHFFGTTLIYPI